MAPLALMAWYSPLPCPVYSSPMRDSGDIHNPVTGKLHDSPAWEIQVDERIDVGDGRLLGYEPEVVLPPLHGFPVSDHDFPVFCEALNSLHNAWDAFALDTKHAPKSTVLIGVGTHRGPAQVRIVLRVGVMASLSCLLDHMPRCSFRGRSNPRPNARCSSRSRCVPT